MPLVSFYPPGNGLSSLTHWHEWVKELKMGLLGLVILSAAHSYPAQYMLESTVKM